MGNIVSPHATFPAIMSNPKADSTKNKPVGMFLARPKPQTDKKAFACFAPLREIHRFVTAQPAKASQQRRKARKESRSKTRLMLLTWLPASSNRSWMWQRIATELAVWEKAKQ